jgi:predicted metal-dependent HD superfamily phosphohydrolase
MTTEIFNLDDLAKFSTLYSEPHRYYHTLEHIYHCLAEYREYGKTQLIKDAPKTWETEKAIWFHDIVYNPRAAPYENEQDSANLYHEWDAISNDSASRRRVYNMILATASHESTDSQTMAFLDVDMSILGAEKHNYAIYKSNIRKEYEFVPTTVYNSYRRKFLKGVLERPRIYLTDFFREKYEKTARANIQGELDVLMCFGV